MSKKRLRIGYCTSTDPHNRRSWSGTHFYIMKTLDQYCGDVVPLGPLNNRLIFPGKVLNKLSRIIFKKRFDYSHSTWISKEYARLLNKKILEENLDVLFVPAGSDLIAYLDTSIPIVYLSDATFGLMLGYYPDFSNFWNFVVNQGQEIEKRAITKSSAVIYASQWAYDSGVNAYECPKEKAFIIPFGANLENIPKRETILLKRQKPLESCKMLFVGVNWERKGGDIALDVFFKLRDLGIDAELTVVGTKLPKNKTHEKVRVIEFLDKNNPSHFKELEGLFLNSDFFILPTRNECAGIVFCEASSYALPILATNTGGVSTYVRQNANGLLFSESDRAESYVKGIIDLLENSEKYYSMSINARDLFDSELNWCAFGTKTRNILEKILSKNECLFSE